MIRVLAVIVFGFSSAAADAAMHLDSARGSYEQAAASLRGLRDQRSRLESELDQVAKQIDSKKKASENDLVRSTELDDLLRRSRSLATTLEKVSRDEASAARATQASELELGVALDAALADARARYETTSDRSEAAHLLDQIKSLREEREGLWGEVGRVTVPSMKTGAGDSTELREQADALRDASDKLQRQLSRINARIRELRNERELDRRMRESHGEAVLFDESDRRLSAVSPSGSALQMFNSTPRSLATGDNGNKSSGAAAPPMAPEYPSTGVPVGLPQLPSSGTNGLTDVGAGSSNPGPGGLFGGGSRASATQDPTQDKGPRAAEGLTPIDPPAGSGSPFPPEGQRTTTVMGFDESTPLEELIRRADEAQRQSQELSRRAAALESRAKQIP